MSLEEYEEDVFRIGLTYKDIGQLYCDLRDEGCSRIEICERIDRVMACFCITSEAQKSQFITQYRDCEPRNTIPLLGDQEDA